MKRVLLIGCSGSGKSTLSRHLGEQLQLPVVHLDRLYWLPGWKPVDNETFDRLLDAELAKDAWIIDGNFNRTLKHRLDACDTVIYLDYPRWLCLLSVCKRVLTHTQRSDMTSGCPERFDLAFMRWIWGFRRKYGAEYDRLLADASNRGIQVLRFRNRRQARRWIEGRHGE